MMKFVYFITSLTFFTIFSYSQNCDVIYVTPNGSAGAGAGTQTNPASLNHAFTIAGPNAQIWLSGGDYNISNTINMQSNLTLEGGFDPVTWEKTNTQVTRIIRNNQNIATNPNRLVAISCVNANLFNIQDIKIEVENAVGDGVTVYGIYLNNCSFYNITRVNISAGNGSDGLPGIDGAPGINGLPGVNGGNGCTDCTNAASRQGGAGGDSGVGLAGGNGGNGGIRSANNCPATSNGTQGLQGQGVGGGIGGTGGVPGCGAVSFGCDGDGPAAQGQPGQPGANGTIGADGANGVPTFGGGFFQNATGQNGQNGGNGSGGGGGGGGASQSGLLAGFPIPNLNDDGPGGAGGGEGGRGGLGATGGGGGGGSFAFFAWNNGFSGRLKDAILESGLPGQGAIGGQFGGIGGIGGSGGPGLNRLNCDQGRGGPGGNGGNGGAGGKGGNGGPGLSFPFYEDPNGIFVQQTNMRSPIEPAVTVNYKGCTFSEVTFTTNANGFVQWFFEGGTIPLIATGNTATVFFNNTGRKTFTLVVNGLPFVFSDFVGLTNDGTSLIPQVLGNDIACPGAPNTYTSSLTGINYRWTLLGGVNPDFYEGAQFQSINNVVFPNVGNYTIIHQVESECCGWSYPDTFQIEVIPIETPEVFINSNAAQVCIGSSTTLSATGLFAGNNPTYEWFVDGVASGSGMFFEYLVPATSSVITVQLTSDYACADQNPVTSLPITVDVFPQPQVTCSSMGNFLGAFTGFSANVTNGTAPYSYAWDFGDGGISNLQNPTHLYASTGSYTATVVVTDANGCEVSCQTIVNIEVAPLVNASFDFTLSSACGESTVSFTDLSTGQVNQWFWDFGDGNTSTLQNPTYTYTSPGIYNVTFAAGNGINFDTITIPNLVNVLPNPVAGFSMNSTLGCTPFQAQFFDQSLGATSWLWNFGDGNTSTLQNPTHVYDNPGTYDITLIISNNVAGCSDTLTLPNHLVLNPSPIVDFNPNTLLVCAGLPIFFFDQSQNGVSFFWDFGDGTTSNERNPKHIYFTPGQYNVTLTVTGANGCQTVLQRNNYISVFEPPVAAFTTFTPEIQLPENTITFLNNSTNFVSSIWNFGTGETSLEENPTVRFLNPGDYEIRLVAISENGCTDTAFMMVTVKVGNLIFIPNSFTPNGDIFNQEFKVVGTGISEFKMRIYNRWGELIFETNDIEIGWDGSDYKREPSPDGVYIYKIDYSFFTGEKETKTGTVTLIR